jgi:hypothetical protein
MKEILRKEKSSFPSQVPPALLLDDCASRIAIELWRTNQFFPCGYHSTVSVHPHLSPWDEQLVAAVQRRSLTPSA